MNLLGHNYIAYKILGKINNQTLIGSHIPDFVPFLPSSIFSFDQIHENHEDFLTFIKSNYPELIDLPLCMMAHSVKYGADEYNRSIDNWLLKQDENLINEISQMIVDASGVSFEIAKGPRLHNYLWCGVDLYIIKNDLDKIATQLAQVSTKIDFILVSKVLSEFYDKNQKKVLQNLQKHFETINANTFLNISDFTKFWSKFLSSLNEGDNLDINKGQKLLEDIYLMFENNWKTIIDDVAEKVQVKMQPFL